MSAAGFAGYLSTVRHDVHARGLLRRGAGMADGLVLPHVAEGEDEGVYFLVGGLFALYPGPAGRGLSLGRAYRVILDEEAKRDGAGRMYQHRFERLLSTPREQIAQPLRHAVALCEKHGQGLDWEQLATDVLAWDDPAGDVKRRLAMEAWGVDGRSTVAPWT